MAKARKQTIDEIRGKDTAELRFDLGETRKELFNARFQPDAESTDTSNVRTLRRTIARILTVLKERETAPEASGEARSES